MSSLTPFSHARRAFKKCSAENNLGRNGKAKERVYIYNMIPYITIPDPSQPLYTMNENTQTSNAMNVYLKIKYTGRGINLILYKKEFPLSLPNSSHTNQRT